MRSCRASPIQLGGLVITDEHDAMPSRHRTAPGKRERPSLAENRMRRCTSDRHLREPVAERASPSSQRRPRARALLRDLPRADPAADLADRSTDEQPQRQRHRDGREAVVLARGDPTRDHEQNRAARGAPVAPAGQRHSRRRITCGHGTTKLPLAQAVAVESEPASGNATGMPACARGRAGRVDRGRRGQPGLDVERVMDDS